MRIGDLRGKELIDRAGAEHLGIVYHVDAVLDETTGRLLHLELLARRGWFGGRQSIPWGTVEKVGRELVIVNLELADRGEPGRVMTVRPDPGPAPNVAAVGPSEESDRPSPRPAAEAARPAHADTARPAAKAVRPAAAESAPTPIAWPWPQTPPPPRRRRRLAR